MKVNNKNKYKQLTSEERDKIAILRAEGKSLTLIATMINRIKSTISRELRRNRTPVYNVYLPHKAHERAITRKQSAGKRLRLKDYTIRTYVINKLEMKWSPELIAGTLPLDHPGLSISHEAIYQYIYDKHIRKQYDLTVHLVRNHKERFAKGHSRKHLKSHIPYRIPINERPKYIEKRIQPGHWEADCMVSRQSKYLSKINLCLVDIREKNIEKSRKNLARFKLEEGVKSYVGMSVSVAKSRDLEVSDLIFLDADHKLEGVQRDVMAYWPLLKTDGIMVFHDSVSWNGVRTIVNAIAQSKNQVFTFASSLGSGVSLVIKRDDKPFKPDGFVKNNDYN